MKSSRMQSGTANLPVRVYPSLHDMIVLVLPFRGAATALNRCYTVCCPFELKTSHRWTRQIVDNILSWSLLDFATNQASDSVFKFRGLWLWVHCDAMMSDRCGLDRRRVPAVRRKDRRSYRWSSCLQASTLTTPYTMKGQYGGTCITTPKSLI